MFLRAPKSFNINFWVKVKTNRKSATNFVNKILSKRLSFDEKWVSHLGLVWGMTQNRNFFISRVSRIKALIYRHFSVQKHDFEPIPYPAYCKFNQFSQFFSKKLV